MPLPRPVAPALAGLAIATLVAFGAPVGPVKAQMSAEQKAEIGTVIREYLLENPEVLMEALEVLQEREQAAQSAQARDAIAANQDMFRSGPMIFAAGPEDASATVVEFFDYRCGYCRRALPVVQELLDEDDDLKVVFLEFPILGPESVAAARAALAVLKLDRSRYLDFHAALMNARSNLTEPVIMATARELGFDPQQLAAAMEDPEIDRALAENYQLAQALGVNGTPAFIVGDKLVPGAVPKGQLEALIAEVRSGG